MTGQELYDLHRASCTRNRLHIVRWQSLPPHARKAWDSTAYKINDLLGVEEQ